MQTQLREAREAATPRITQEQLAQAVGVTVSTINRIENGVTVPTLSTAQAIARVLGKTVDELFPEPQEASA